MKKIFFVIALAMLAFSVNAEIVLDDSSKSSVETPFKVGGSFGIGWIQNIGVDFTLSPEFTYDINDQWGVGGAIGINVMGNQYGSAYSIVASPYARYTPWRVGIFSLFLDMGFSLGGRSVSSDPLDNFMASVGVSPGLAFDFTKHFTFIMNLGFVGYQYNMNPKVNLLGAGGPNSVGIDLSSSNLSIGGFFRF